MEGKEQRFGPMLSSLWAAATTAASNGSVDAMHDSFMPLSGLVMLVNMDVGEVIFGGVGAGLYGILLYVVLAVFLAGLMVGRTPEYLGRKIEAREVTLALLAFLAMPAAILTATAIGAIAPGPAAAIQDRGPHGFSEVLYAWSSMVANNGSAFAGWGAALPWQTTLGGIAMLIGRYMIIVPMLAIAGSMLRKTPAAATAGTFPTHGPLFVVLLILTILILGALDLLPRPRSRADRGRGVAACRSELLRGRNVDACDAGRHARPLRHRPAPGLRQARPAASGAQSRDLHHRVVATLTTVLGARDLIRRRRWACQPAYRALAVDLRALRHLRRGAGRRPRPGAGRQPAGHQGRDRGESCWPDADAAPETATPAASSTLRAGMIVLVVAGDLIPTDGEVISGVASVDESAITGESAPVIRESGGDRSGVTGGTRVVSDSLVIRVTVEPGRSFLDRMIALVEGAERQKTPNEIALDMLLAGLTLIFLIVVVTLEPFARYAGTVLPVVSLAALFVTLIPTTIGGPAVGDRHRRHGPAGARQCHRQVRPRRRGGGRCRYVAPRQDRHHHLRQPHGRRCWCRRRGSTERALAEATLLASLADETPEGKSAVELCRRLLAGACPTARDAAPVPFSAQTRISGVDLADGTRLRKGAVDAILRFTGARMPQRWRRRSKPSPAPAARRCWLPATATSLARFI